MVVSSQVVRFQKSTGGNGTTQDVNLTFTPIAIIVFSSGGTAEATTEAHFQQIVGFSDGTNHACYATQSEDNANAADAGRIHYNNRVFAKLDTATVTNVVCQGTCAFATNKVTFTWTVNDAVATDITLVAYGGTDITAAKVNTVDIGRTTVGTQDYTGLGFTPTDNNSVIFTLGAFIQTINTATDHAIGSFGCATKAVTALSGPNNQWCLAYCSEDVSDPSDTWRAYNNDRCYDVLDTTGAYAHYGFLKAWVSDGFQLNWDGPPTATTFKFSYLAINGGKWDSGYLTAPTSATNNVDYTVLSGITTNQIRSLFMAGHGEGGGLATINTYSIGATDGTNVSTIGAIDEDAQNTMDSYRYSDNTGIYHLMGTNGVTTDRATFDSFSTNNFRLDWGTKGSIASHIGWIVVADVTTPTLFTRSITESSISVSDSNAKLFTVNRALSESSISVSESNTKLLTAFRTISEPSISVSDTNARIKIAPRSISEASVSVSDSLARLLTANRSISDTVTVSDTLTRFSLKIRSISESSISVSETVARVKIALRSISEASISVSETVAKLFTAVRTLADTITVSDSVAGIIIAGLITRTITEASISVSETVARLLTANRSISEASVSVSDSLARFSLKIRSLSEPSISVSETLARIPIRVRNISENVSVSDALARFTLQIRAITEASITVSDALARVKIALRAISEPSISVSDSNARLLTANRALSEAAITVSDTLTRFSLKIRAIADTVTVSETVARIKIALRSLAEPSISVSDALARIKIGVRAISEAAISVSDTLTRSTVKLKAISEAAISVSDALAIDRTKIRTITELPITVSETVTRSIPSLFRVITEPSISVSDVIIGFKVVPILATYITDDGYTNEVRMRITFKSKVGDDASDPDTGDEVTFYQYDSFVPQARPFNILSWDLRLVQDEVSVATIDIEDHAGIITDKNKISFKAAVEIDFKKELGREWQRMMTGFVRRIRTVRPGYNALIYRITVLSKQIVYNERVVNFKRAAKRSAIDSSIPLSTDSKMEANNLFRELHTATDIMPLKGPTVQQTGDFDLETGSISEEVKDFIAEIAPGLGVATDVARSIGEVTGAIWGTDEYGNPYLRYPTEKHSGIILKDNPSDTDSAWNTSINMSAFEFEDIIDNSEGFANRLYVLNSKDTKSTASSSKGSGNTTLTTRWIAQSFIATDNNVSGAAFILSKIGNPTNTAGTIKGVLRANNVGGSGTNYPTGSTLATFEISLGSLANSADVIFVNDIKTANGVINPGSRYWWVLQGTGLFDDTNTVRWHHDNDLSTLDRPSSARLPLVDADPTKPGQQLNWIPSTVGPVYAFSTFSSINHILTQSDSESIASTGTLVEAVVNLPAFNDDATYQKVLVQLLKSSSKIKRIYEYARVTIPTAKFFLPGELVTLIDSKAKLDSEKVIHAEIVEVSYSMSSAIGCKYADLRMIGFIDPVLDNYLSTHEC